MSAYYLRAARGLAYASETNHGRCSCMLFYVSDQYHWHSEDGTCHNRVFCKTPCPDTIDADTPMVSPARPGTKKYEAKVYRTVTQRYEAFVLVEAIDEDEAGELAQELAETGSVEWDGDCCDGSDAEVYEVSDIEEVQT